MRRRRVRRCLVLTMGILGKYGDLKVENKARAANETIDCWGKGFFDFSASLLTSFLSLNLHRKHRFRLFGLRRDSLDDALALLQHLRRAALSRLYA